MTIPGTTQQMAMDRTDDQSQFEILHDTEAVVLSMYHQLWQKNKQGRTCPNVNLPPTVVYDNGKPLLWYFSSVKEGMILRKHSHNVRNPVIFEAFTRESALHGICSIFMGQHDIGRESESSRRNKQYTHEEVEVILSSPLMEHVDADRLAVLLKISYSTEGGNEAIYRGVLQRFVQPRDGRNFMIRATWSPQVCTVERRVNKSHVDDHQGSIGDCFSTFEGETLKTEAVQLTGTALTSKIHELCQDMARHIHEINGNKIRLLHCEFYFKVDPANVIWFLYAKDLRLESSVSGGLYIRGRTGQLTWAPALHTDENGQLPAGSVGPGDEVVFICAVTGQVTALKLRYEVTYRTLMQKYMSEIKGIYDEKERAKAMAAIPPAIRRAMPTMSKEWYLHHRDDPEFQYRRAFVCKSIFMELNNISDADVDEKLSAKLQEAKLRPSMFKSKNFKPESLPSSAPLKLSMNPALVQQDPQTPKGKPESAFTVVSIMPPVHHALLPQAASPSSRSSSSQIPSTLLAQGSRRVDQVGSQSVPISQQSSMARDLRSKLSANPDLISDQRHGSDRASSPKQVSVPKELKPKEDGASSAAPAPISDPSSEVRSPPKSRLSTPESPKKPTQSTASARAEVPTSPVPVKSNKNKSRSAVAPRADVSTLPVPVKPGANRAASADVLTPPVPEILAEGPPAARVDPSTVLMPTMTPENSAATFRRNSSGVSAARADAAAALTPVVTPENSAATFRRMSSGASAARADLPPAPTPVVTPENSVVTFHRNSSGLSAARADIPTALMPIMTAENSAGTFRRTISGNCSSRLEEPDSPFQSLASSPKFGVTSPAIPQNTHFIVKGQSGDNPTNTITSPSRPRELSHIDSWVHGTIPNLPENEVLDLPKSHIAGFESVSSGIPDFELQPSTQFRRFDSQTLQIMGESLASGLVPIGEVEDLLNNSTSLSGTFSVRSDRVSTMSVISGRRRSGALAVSQADKQTLKDLTVAYAQAQEQTQQLLAQAQELLRTSNTSRPGTSSRRSPHRTAQHHARHLSSDSPGTSLSRDNSVSSMSELPPGVPLPRVGGLPRSTLSRQGAAAGEPLSGTAAGEDGPSGRSSASGSRSQSGLGQISGMNSLESLAQGNAARAAAAAAVGVNSNVSSNASRMKAPRPGKPMGTGSQNQSVASRTHSGSSLQSLPQKLAQLEEVELEEQGHAPSIPRAPTVPQASSGLPSASGPGMDGTQEGSKHSSRRSSANGNTMPKNLSGTLSFTKPQRTPSQTSISSKTGALSGGHLVLAMANAGVGSSNSIDMNQHLSEMGTSLSFGNVDMLIPATRLTDDEQQLLSEALFLSS